jgi:hypothetical protein
MDTMGAHDKEQHPSFALADLHKEQHAARVVADLHFALSVLAARRNIGPPSDHTIVLKINGVDVVVDRPPVEALQEAWALTRPPGEDVLLSAAGVLFRSATVPYHACKALDELLARAEHDPAVRLTMLRAVSEAVEMWLLA